MALFSQQQPSFADLATMFKATGGRYDPTTPSGQAQLRQDMMREAQRAEAFRNAASAVQERKALQEIQASESSRPSQEVAPGVRAIVKDGQVVGYSTPPQAGRKAVFRDLPYGATSLDQVSEVARAIPAGWRTASDEALAMGDQAAPFQKGFLSALQKAQAAKSAPPAASDAAPGATMPPSQSPGPWAAGYRTPDANSEKPGPWGAGYVSAASKDKRKEGFDLASLTKDAKDAKTLSSAMQRIIASAKEAPARAAAEQRKAKLDELVARRDELLRNLQSKRAAGTPQPTMGSGGMSLFLPPQNQPLDPQGEAQLAAAIEQLNAQIAALEAETK